MKTITAILCSLYIGCSGSQPGFPRADVPSPALEVIDDAALELFRQNSVDGAFVLYDARRSMTTIVNPSLASRGFLPASTFKIPNTVIGLETGVIPDEHFSQRWDGVKRGRTEWNRDQDLASAMKYSVVWFYQEVARRIGQPRMQKWLNTLDYGNHDTSGGIDMFWLQGGLRITPRQQVDFLWQLSHGKAAGVARARRSRRTAHHP
jgi:beta-lactamase class D